MIKKIYVYVILFATLMMVIGGSVGVFNSLADILTPPTYHQSYEQYKNNMPPPKGNTQDNTEQPALTEEQSRANYNDMVAQEKINIRNNAVNRLIKSLGWIIIPLPIFLYFQRRLKTLDHE
ncbi:MAG TPA: hypothetical protein VGE40_00665 [Bacilli bacterium]